ncbi:MAG TPA: riboflavin kinase, partial [Sphingomonadales bacterium]|nr:riboflavin kinase [Sphingomonadales bacterium]
MEILRHYEDIPETWRGAAAALGNFDGFHRGHQAVVGEAGRIARKEKIPLAVVVSEPHPRTFFSPDAEPFRLTGFRERLALFESFGVDLALVLPFTKELSSFPPERFAAEVLAKGLGLKHVVVGYDYRFGKGRAGDAVALKSLGEKYGIAVHEIAPVPFGVEGVAGVPYSSTLVREALKKGEARKAAAMLGHWWTVNGAIDFGERRGRRIGFPTSNIAFAGTLIPR